MDSAWIGVKGKCDKLLFTELTLSLRASAQDFRGNPLVREKNVPKSARKSESRCDFWR